MKKIFILILFTTTSFTTCFSQINDTIYKAYASALNEEIIFHNLKKIKDPSISNYEGSYHFGDSEAESQLEILYSNNKVFARKEYSIWENDTWIPKSIRKSSSYKKGILYVDNESFQLYTYDKEQGLGSSYNKTENEKTYHYLQFNYDRSIKKPLGKYPETSFVKLTKSDFINYSNHDLKIIRNEIFARNGYPFKIGGKMHNYFSSKNWYKHIKKTKTTVLSEIEKHNINLIKSLEQINNKINTKHIPDTIKSKLSIKSEQSYCLIKNVEKHNGYNFLTVDFIQITFISNEHVETGLITNDNTKLRSFIISDKLLKKYHKYKSHGVIHWKINVSKGRVISLDYIMIS